MNATMQKFGHPATLVADYEHWAVLVRPAQVTLGSLVLAAKSDATAYGQLTAAAFAEQFYVIGAIERALKTFSDYEKINYLMLMMVDRHVHFHVVPRYKSMRIWAGIEFLDAGWPGPPRLDATTAVEPETLQKMKDELPFNFR
jgi:diadenosine tetraphosphate (Ap4A) HIT family hydrolase